MLKLQNQIHLHSHLYLPNHYPYEYHYTYQLVIYFLCLSYLLYYLYYHCRLYIYPCLSFYLYQAAVFFFFYLLILYYPPYDSSYNVLNTSIISRIFIIFIINYQLFIICLFLLLYTLKQTFALYKTMNPIFINQSSS